MEPAAPVMVEKSSSDEVMLGNTQSAKGEMVEVSPRDGLQNEEHAVTTAAPKLELRLALVVLRHENTSFHQWNNTKGVSQAPTCLYIARRSRRRS